MRLEALFLHAAYTVATGPLDFAHRQNEVLRLELMHEKKLNSTDWDVVIEHQSTPLLSVLLSQQAAAEEDMV